MSTGGIVTHASRSRPAVTPGLGDQGRPTWSTSRKRTGSVEGDSSHSESGGGGRSGRRKLECEADGGSSLVLLGFDSNPPRGRPSAFAVEVHRRQIEDARNLPVMESDDMMLGNEVA